MAGSFRPEDKSGSVCCRSFRICRQHVGHLETYSAWLISSSLNRGSISRGYLCSRDSWFVFPVGTAMNDWCGSDWLGTRDTSHRQSWKQPQLSMKQKLTFLQVQGVPESTPQRRTARLKRAWTSPHQTLFGWQLCFHKIRPRSLTIHDGWWNPEYVQNILYPEYCLLANIMLPCIRDTLTLHFFPLLHQNI